MNTLMIPSEWKTQRLIIKDSILADLPDLDQILTACAYIEEWSGWKAEHDSPKSMLPILTGGSYLSMALKNFFDCSRFGLVIQAR
jgi:hypothetical protein